MYFFLVKAIMALYGIFSNILELEDNTEIGDWLVICLEKLVSFLKDWFDFSNFQLCCLLVHVLVWTKSWLLLESGKAIAFLQFSINLFKILSKPADNLNLRFYFFKKMRHCICREFTTFWVGVSFVFSISKHNPEVVKIGIGYFNHQIL